MGTHERWSADDLPLPSQLPSNQKVAGSTCRVEALSDVHQEAKETFTAARQSHLARHRQW